MNTKVLHSSHFNTKLTYLTGKAINESLHRWANVCSILTSVQIAKFICYELCGFVGSAKCKVQREIFIAAVLYSSTASLGEFFNNISYLRITIITSIEIAFINIMLCLGSVYLGLNASLLIYFIEQGQHYHETQNII